MEFKFLDLEILSRYNAIFYLSWNQSFFYSFWTGNVQIQLVFTSFRTRYEWWVYDKWKIKKKHDTLDYISFGMRK